MSVLVFQLSVAPHVQQAARSLHEAGQLARLVTSVVDQPGSPRQRLLTRIGKLAGLDLRREFSKRALTEIPDHLVECHPWGELLRVAVARVGRDELITDAVWERVEKHFDRKVARRVSPALTGVYGFEYGSLATFQRAKRLGLRIGYEMPAPDPRFVRGVLERELTRFPALRDTYQQHLAAKEPERTTRRQQEWQLADVIIAASRFTRDSFASAGLSVGKVKVLPLGAPPPVSTDGARDGGSRRSGPLELLWAGSFSVRKGAHYVLDAWRRGEWGQRARLRVYGAPLLPAGLTRELPEGIELHAPVPRSDLMEIMSGCDALVFPTLCDGFGMVATEAWSRGLPVITTDCAGAADLLRDGENGLLIRAGDTGALMDAVDWCLRHRDELQAMRPAARETAARWQWSDYRRSHAEMLAEAGLFGPVPAG